MISSGTLRSVIEYGLPFFYHLRRTLYRTTCGNNHPQLKNWKIGFFVGVNERILAYREKTLSSRRCRGVVVNFDLEERFARPRSQQRGSLRPRARRVAVLGVGAGRGRPPPAKGIRGVIPGNFF